MKTTIIPLTEEQISALPFPDTARKIGGLLVLEDEALSNHLNIEWFRRQWNEYIKNSETKTSAPEEGCQHSFNHYENEHFEVCFKCGERQIAGKE